MSSSRRTVALVLAFLTAGALAAGCDSTQESTVSREEVVQVVADRAQEALQALPAGATLKQRLHQPDLTCNDQDRDGEQFVETNYQVEYPEGWPVDRSMADLSAYWERSGYKIVRDDRNDATTPELVVEKESDGYHIGYLISRRSSGKVDVYLRSSSPCFQF
ncbi:hypothetical protein [Actinoplanes friuliensis]|jgi:hypothetical protein|uniref:Lipoprotein n=1 Tax=Actinoplanes friuliensis DSM 7358 TaxID=1246995 RepID=U5W0N9_9ACTN|nr:hypothetical protein [Actinoplanes friuliensis]AGZ42808.1 hypothetical protein AFR_22690 [Actinoplanes friuliensis DSM 7358]